MLSRKKKFEYIEQNHGEIGRLRFQQTEEIKDLIDLGRDLKFVIA